MTKLLLTLIATTTLCFAADPFVGTWKPANVEKWKTSPGFPDGHKSEVVTFELLGKDQYRMTVSSSDGKSTGNPVVWNVDGKEHKSESGYTVKFVRIDQHHLRQSYSTSKGSGVFDWVVSTDGEALTETRKGIGSTSGRPLDELYVYERK